VCRASPSLKANIVNMMPLEIHIAQIGSSITLRWLARQNRNLQVRSPSVSY
jgi:hypothetical protein